MVITFPGTLPQSGILPLSLHKSTNKLDVDLLPYLKWGLGRKVLLSLFAIILRRNTIERSKY